METEIKDKDALDALRRFVRQQKIQYATINAQLEVEDYVVKFIKIDLGGIIFKIKAIT